MPKIYLDYAASSPVDPEVFRAMQPYFMEKFGNPGSLHAFGQEAITAVDRSRETIAKAIHAHFREIVFVSSATEANNLALRGAVGFAARKENSSRNTKSVSKKPRIIVSAVEHESVIETARDLERSGIDVVYLPVDERGIVDLKKLSEAFDERTVLVSVMYANNEIGTVQPIAEIGALIQEFRKKSASRTPYPLFHTDAAQAFQFLGCDVQKLGVDLMTLSAHKIYGPKGIGGLYLRNLAPHPSPIAPLLSGGGQELSLRPGTENVPSIVGFAKAVELKDRSLAETNEHMKKLRDHLCRGILQIYPRAGINGSTEDRERLPNILNIHIPDTSAQAFLTKLDLHGLATSSGSACRSRAITSSYVIEALGYGKERALSSIRFSLGRPTTKKEIDAALTVIKRCA